MHRSSPTKLLPSSYPISNTHPVLEDCSSPPPIFNLHINPHNNFLATPDSPRHPQSPLSSPPYFHISPLPDDTNCDNSSNDSPTHNVLQSTKIYPYTPPPIKTNDIPLTSVNSIFDQSESPGKTYSSCCFPPELK